MIEKMWNGVGMLVVLGCLGALGFWILSPKRVDGYYISHGGNNGSTAATCVYAHWTWHWDELAFCSDDYQKALDFMNKADAEIKAGK
jgi:hypothetical protein